MCRPDLGLTQTPIQWILEDLSQGGRSVKLTSHLLLVLRLRIFNFNLRFHAMVLRNSSTVSTVERLCNQSGYYFAWEETVFFTAYVSGSQIKLPRKTDVMRARER
jgi:hypothetical protein